MTHAPSGVGKGHGNPILVDETLEFRRWQVQLVRARRMWRCDNCSRVILKGEQYERDLVWHREDGYVTLRYCTDCDAMSMPWWSWLEDEAYKPWW